jgi:hypothetical protein
MVHPCAIVRDQPQPLARLPDQPRVNMIGDRGNQHVAAPHRVGQLFPAHCRVRVAQFNVEQFLHPGLDRLGQASRYDNTQTSCWHCDLPALPNQRIEWQSDGKRGRAQAPATGFAKSVARQLGAKGQMA